MKICTKCKLEKPLDAFSKNIHGPDGLQYSCQACNKQYRRENQEAIRAGQKRYRLENKEKIRLIKTRYYSENQEAIRAEKALYYLENQKAILHKKRKYYSENRKSVISNRRRRLYGVDSERYESMRAAQNNRCAMCGDEFLDVAYIDHSHKTGIVRALLCRGCNTGLGCFKDSPSRCLAAAAYLQKFGEK